MFWSRVVSKMSATTAPIAADGPAFDATIVYVTGTPGVYVADPSVFAIDRFACEFCISVSVAVLLPGTGSVTPPGAATVAVFTRSPVASDRTAAVTV